MAMEALWAYKLRSLFVIMGVAMGIASLTLIVTAVDGANRKALEIVEMFGPDAAFVLGGNIKKRAVGMRTLTLSHDDARRIRQSLPGAYLVVPMRAKGGLTIRYRNKNYQDVFVVGATENYATVWNWPLQEGRDIRPDDERTGARVALLGSKPARELFGQQSPVGKTVFVGGIPFQVVGLLSYRGMTGGGGDIDNRVIIPLSTLTSRFNLDRKYFRALRVKFYEPAYMDAHTENLRSLLRHLHELAPEDDDDFTILTADEVLKFLSMFKGGLAVFLGVTATIAMLVGGFVLANLFTISVSERSEEIGLKRAMGAHRSAIMGQFLLEASLLTLVGGVLGLLLGLGLGQLLSRLDILVIRFSWKAFAMAMGSALAVGLVFGLKPARHAASLDPIKALKGMD
jgi:putative ABC transport system permease protein